MNGAVAFFSTLEAAGVDVCFANPGTTEMALVAGMEATSIRPFLVLQESVAAGAADGFARMVGRPASTLLHLGPGLANAASNLHNARRAGSPVINVVGDHRSDHLRYDAPLTSGIALLAGFTQGWTGSSRDAEGMGQLATEAVEAANLGQVATAIVAVDHQTGPSHLGRTHSSSRPAASGDPDVAIRYLQDGGALYVGGGSLHGDNLDRLAEISAGTGCRVIAETFPARIDRGVGRLFIERLPYFPDQAIAALTGLPSLVMVGSRAPVSFFAYPDAPQSLLPEGTAAYRLADRSEEVEGVLGKLAQAVGADPHFGVLRTPDRPEGPIDAVALGTAIASVQPAEAIVVDEAATSGLPYFLASGSCPPYTHLTLTGGSLGFGLPAAVGAAIACPERPVIAFQADGAGMYSLQALWTMARYGLNVTVVIASNRQYRILRIEAGRAGLEGGFSDALTDISGLDWVKLAEGHGVPARSVSDARSLANTLEEAVASPGPFLIEAQMAL